MERKKIYVLLLCLVVMKIIVAQENIVPQSFRYLKVLIVDENIDGCGWHSLPAIYYNHRITQVKNKIVQKDHPLYYDIAEEMGFTELIRTKIDYRNDIYYQIYFNDGPSCDPSFSIYKEVADSLVRVRSISALQLFIPGNGAVYSQGHANTNYNVRRKYKMIDNKLEEQKQAYSYVGLKSETNEKIIIYADKSLQQQVAILPSGAKIEVLLNDEEYYLIKTSFGLLGWWKPEKLYPKTSVNGLYYHGD